MPYYSDPTLYSTPISSYSLYLSGPYSTHSSLIASRSARPPNTYVKPLSRFHRGYAPHLSTITENQANSALRRKYSPHLPYGHGSAKYKVPRPIKINTADIDVSADRYKSRIIPSSLDTPRSRIVEQKKDSPKSPSPSKLDDGEEFVSKPIRRDRPTVRIHTLHRDDEKKLTKPAETETEKPSPPKDEAKKSISDSNDVSTPKDDTKKRKPYRKNPSFHDICTAISQDSINDELNPGQPDSVKRKQNRTHSNENFSKQVDSTEILKGNANLLEPMLDDETINENRDKAEQKVDATKEDNKFDPRGSVKRKKKIAKKKTNENLVSDDESNLEKCQLQRRPVKKIKRTSTDTSVQSDASENVDDQQDVIKDISNVEVEEIKAKPKQVISATVEIEAPKQKKPNLKLVIDDVKVEEIQSPKTLKKFKLNVTVNVEPERSANAKVDGTEKRDKCKITDEDKGKVHVPKAKDALVTCVKKNHQRASLGDIYEDIEAIPKKKTEKSSRKKSAINGEVPDAELESGQNQLAPKGINQSTENFWAAILINSSDKNNNLSQSEIDSIVKPEISRNGTVNDGDLREDITVGKGDKFTKQDSSEKFQPDLEEVDKTVSEIQPASNNLENSNDTTQSKFNETSGAKLEHTGETHDDTMLDKKVGTQTQNYLSSLQEDQNSKKLKLENKKEDQNASKTQTQEITTATSKPEINALTHPVDENQNLPDKRPNQLKCLNRAEKVEEDKENGIKPPKGLQSLDTKKPLVPNKKIEKIQNEKTKIFQKNKKSEPISPEVKPSLPPKEENQSTENFWALIGSRESGYIRPVPVLKRNAVYIEQPAENNKENETIVAEKNKINEEKDAVQPTKEDEGIVLEENVTNNVDKAEEKDNTQEKTVPTKITSKGSLVKKPKTEDPDLKIFSAPSTPEPKEPESPTTAFTPLQSNRLSQWMHPWKKPEQFDECPIEIFARPKPIKARHIPRPRHPQPPPPPPPQQTGSSESEEESSEEDSGDSEEVVTTTDDEANVGKSTSSNDSGFNSSTNGSSIMQRNKDCDVNIHRKCEKLTANLCGVNQKLIVEAIESVKKGSSDTRDSPTSNPAHNPAFALDPADTLEEFYTSSTYAGFQKSGRITPPATTIPRFRKYCVEDFNFLKVLGKGSFGKVLLAELKETEYYYAIKCLKKDVVLEDDDVECTLIERKVLALGTKHPYLCHLLCTFQTESHLFFVMEYLNGGDLMFHIQMSGRFPEPRGCIYGAEIVSGLKFLHTKGIVYRDLKLDNILLDFDGHVRIADFGMCKLQIFLDRTADTFCGTPDYMAPEIIKGLHYNQCVDWWSFGVLLYEMLIGQSPFSGCDEDELFWSICNEKPVIPRFLSAEATSILKQLLEKDSGKRLGNKMSPHGDIQDHPFFRPISWDLLERRQLEAPFKPNLQHPLDTQYFDKTFTVEKAKLTPIDKNILQSMDQAQFQGFSYTNPNATDR